MDRMVKKIDFLEVYQQYASHYIYGFCIQYIDMYFVSILKIYLSFCLVNKEADGEKFGIVFSGRTSRDRLSDWEKPSSCQIKKGTNDTHKHILVM